MTGSQSVTCFAPAKDAVNVHVAEPERQTGVGSFRCDAVARRECRRPCRSNGIKRAAELAREKGLETE